MITKCFEVRDRATCIPALAIKMVPANPIEDKYLSRCGYPLDDGSTIVLMKLSDQQAHSDPYDWTDARTLRAAHIFILDNFDDLREGQVVDVRNILGEQASAAAPEIWV